MRLTQMQIQVAADMRRHGATFNEIAEVLGVPEPSIYYHVRDTPCSKDGHRVVYRSLADIMAMWKPAPFMKVPVPTWMLTFIEDQGTVQEPPGEMTLNVLNTPKEES